MYGQVNGLRNEGGATCATGDITYAHVWLGRAIVVVSVAPGLRLAPDDPGLDRLRSGEAASVRRQDGAGIGGRTSDGGATIASGGAGVRIESVRTAVIQGNFPWVLVKIETDEGITGLGEAYWGAGVAELVHKAKPLLIGENPRNIGKLFEIMIRCLSGEGSLAGATVTAISGIEIALWDLVGRALEHADLQPLRRPLPRPHPGLRRLPRRRHARSRRLRQAGARGGRRRDSPPSSSTSTRAIPSRSTSRTIRIRAGTGSSPSTAPSARAETALDGRRRARRARGRRTRDHGRDGRHWKFSVNDAIKLAQALEPFDLLWLEDPVPPENIEAQRHVTHSTRTPICTGENLYRKHGYRELIEKQAARIIAPDIPKMGGLIEAQEGRRPRRPLLHPGRAPQRRQPDRHVAAAHVCAAMNNFLVIEYHAHDVAWWGDLVDGEPPDQGRLHPSRRSPRPRPDPQRGRGAGAPEAGLELLRRRGVRLRPRTLRRDGAA